MLVRLLIVLAVLFLWFVPGHQAGSWPVHGSASIPVGIVSCNLNTGVATGTGSGTCVATPSTCNGATDNTQAFYDYTNWAVNTWQMAHSGTIQLNFSGACRINPDFAHQDIFAGIINHVVDGGSGSLTNISGTITVSFGGDGLNNQNGVASHCALISTVSAGATQVTAITGSEAGLMTVGNYAVVLGLDMQGAFNSDYGYPPNPAFHDYVKVLTRNTGTGVVTFDVPLNYDYKSTWPTIGTDPGPATICPLPASWNITAEYRNFTFTQGGFGGDVGTKAQGLNITWRNMTFTGPFGPYGTLNKYINFINVSCPLCTNESDKMIDLVTITGGTFDLIKNQSSSITQTTMSGTTLNQMDGTNKKFVGSNLTIPTLHIGPSGFGSTTDFTCSNCVLGATAFEFGSVLDDGISHGIANVYTMASGIISVPNGQTVTNWANNGSGAFRLTVASTAGFTTGKYIEVQATNTSLDGQRFQMTVIDGTHLDFVGSTFSATTGGYIWPQNPLKWAIPGANIFFGGNEFNEAAFYIVDVTQELNTGCQCIKVQTNLAGGFPAVNGGVAPTLLRTHPAPHWTCTTCTGNPIIASTVGGTPGAPFLSYYSRTYNGSSGFPFSGGPAFPTLYAWGTLTSLTVNVATAYSGAQGSLGYFPFSVFTTIKADQSDYVWFPNDGSIINAKQTGIRVVTGSGVTCNGSAGACSGDANLTPPEAVWLTGTPTTPTRYDHDISAENPSVWPSIVVTVQTNQGLH